MTSCAARRPVLGEPAVARPAAARPAAVRPAAAKPAAGPPRTSPVMPDSGLASADDQFLVTRLAAGCQESLAELYRRHGVSCYRLARHVTASTSLAEDAVQEAFLAMWQQPQRYQPGLGSVRTWLLGLAHHKAVDAVRRQASWQRRQDLVLTDQLADAAMAPDPGELAIRNLRAAEVRSAVDDLPAPQRQALLLAYFAGYTQTEIAALTGVPLGTVKTRTLAAMRRLRLRLEGASVLAGKESAP
jgi:RNA polymerase sigma factor (sigma-70 family)